MKTNLLLSIACCAAFASSAVFAQSAPLRGVGLLALGASEPRVKSLVEMTDVGGGSVGARAMRGADGGDHARPATTREREDEGATPDSLPPAALPIGDPTAPAAATPKRPTYRWQTLVPGAIK